MEAQGENGDMIVESYVLIISSLVLMTGLIVACVNVIVLFLISEINPGYDGSSWVSYYML